MGPQDEVKVRDGKRYSRNYDPIENRSQILSIGSVLLGIGGIVFTGYSGMLCGPLCFFGMFISIPGMIIGFIALGTARKRDDSLNRVLSITGIMLNTITISISFLGAAFLILFLLLNITPFFLV